MSKLDDIMVAPEKQQIKELIVEQARILKPEFGTEEYEKWLEFCQKVEEL